MPRVLKTWERRQIKPLFHISEQRIGSSIGTHSDLIDTIPQYLLDLETPIDLEVEAKLKEQAIQRLYQRYPSLNPLPPPKIIRVFPKPPKKEPLPVIKVRPNRS
jgi:UV DNA damage repair endonuclease